MSDCRGHVDHIRLGPGEKAYPTPEEIDRAVNQILKGVRRQQMSVRAKFKVTSVKSFAEWSGKEITLTPQYDQNIEEDRRYAKATPSGEIRMTVDNPPAADQLALGKFFYVDFNEVPAMP